MKRFDPHVGGAGQGLSAGKSHRSLKTLLRNAAAIILFSSVASEVRAQASLSSATYTQDFDAATAAALPTGWKIGAADSYSGALTTSATGITSGSPAGTQAVATALTGTSSGMLGLFKDSANDQALGILNTGTVTSPKSVYFAFTNNTGSTVTAFSLAWDYEKFRSGSRAFDWTLFGGTTNAVDTAITTGNKSYAVDGANTTIYMSNNELVSAATASVTGLTLTTGETFYLEWKLTGVGGSSNGQALGIDNFSLTATLASVGGNFWNGASGAWSSSSTNWATATAGGGTTGVTQAASGALIFDTPSINPTVSGTVTVAAGLTFGANGISISSGTINLSGANPATNAITVSNLSDTATLSSALTGTQGLTKLGNGKLVLSADNSGLTGVVTLSAGTLRASSANALGAGTLSIAGGTLELASNNGVSFGRNTTVSADATIKSDRAAQTPGAGATQTLGTLSMGGQTLTIDRGSNVNEGTSGITFGAVTLSGAPTFIVNTGSLLTLASVTVTGTAQNISVNGAGDTTVSGAIATTTGSLTKSGNGILTLNGANTFTGGLTLNAGTVSLGNSGALNSTAGSENTVTFGSGSTGTLSLNGNNSTIAGLNTNATAGTTFVKNGSASTNATLTIGNSTNTNSTFAGVIQNGSTGTLALNKAGTGTLTLTSANTYTGGTTINQGKIVLSGGSLASGTVSIANGATLATSGVASAGSLSLVTGSNLDLTSAGLSLTGALTASGGNLNYTLGNTLAVTGALTLSGAVNISLAGNFEAKRYDLVTFASGDASNFSVTTTRLGWSITPVITGTKYSIDIAIASANLNWNLSGDGNWDTNTADNWFNSKNSSTKVFADGDTVTFAQSTGGVITISGIVSPASTTVNSSGDYTFQSGTLAGDGGITKSGTGKLTLSAANTFTGEVVVNAGTLVVGNANALGATSTGTRIISGATLEISGNIILAVEPLTLAGAGVEGVGALTSSSGINTISGPITLNGSTLITSQGTSLLDILTLSGSVTGSSSTFSIGGDADTIISGNISGTGLALNKIGDGVLTLSGTSNTYTGGTTITGGKIIAGTSNLTGTITANAILQLDQTVDGTFAGNISGSGELIKEGTGTVTLSGTNSVSSITINNGALVIASSTALPTVGTLALTSGSLLTLSSAGTYGAATQTVTLTPTNSNSVALNIGSGNAVTLASNLIIGSQTQIAVPGANGVLTLSGVLSGSGKLFKTDLGKIIISGTSNNFTGNTEVQNGILTLNAGSSLGTGALTMNANGSLATLELNESASVASLISGVSTTANNIISIASEKTLTINESFTRTFGTTVGSSTFTINGLGGLTMAGSGVLILDSTNSYTGLTSVTAGTLTANNSAAISSSASVSSGAVLNLNDNQTLTSLAGSGEVRIADGKTFTLNNSTTQNFGGTFTATTGTAFTKSGSGTLNLSGASTSLARDITLSAGTIKAANNSALGTGTVLIGTGGSGTTGTLYVASDKTISNNITIGTEAAKGTTTSSKLTLLSFSLSGNSGAGISPYVTTGTKNAAITSFTGLTRGTGASTPTGSLPASAWAASNMTATSATAAVTANQYVTFGFKSTTSGFTLDTSLILPYINYRSTAGSDQVQWAFKINNGSYTDLGGIQLVGTSTTIPTTVTPTLANDITMAAGDEITFRLAIFKVTTTGGGNWYLKDNINTVDDIGIQGYVVNSYDNPAWGSGVLGIDESGTATFTGNVVVNNTAELTAATGGTAIFQTGVISGLGSLTKTGNGTVELKGANTFTGSLTLTAGNLKVSTLGAGGAASPLGAAADVPGSIIFNGGKLEYAGSGETLTRDFTVGNGGAGFIASGAGALVIGEGAQMDFDNAEASNRTLTLGGTTDIAVENIFNPKKFDAADITNLFTKLVKQDVNKWVVLGAGAGFVDADTTEMNVDGGELDFAMGSLGSASNKAHINVGSATLGWNGTHTDDVSGRIYLNNNSAAAAFNIPSGTVTLNSAFNGGAVTSASLTKLGTGTLELGGANKFSGGLTVSAGTVKATATSAVGSGAVSVSRNATFVVNAVLSNRISVSAGATLAGNGTDEDATIEEDGILSPNADSIGTLSFNKLALNGGAHVKWQLRDATGAAGVGYDTLVVSALNLNNAISTKKKIVVNVTSTGSFLNFDKTKVNKFEFAKITTDLANGVNVTDLFSIDAEQFEIANNLINDHLVWSMQYAADRDMMYVTTMIPEPSTYGLGLGALALAVVAVRRRKKKKV
jgi:autotransporter-associated beta strand protein